MAQLEKRLTKAQSKCQKLEFQNTNLEVGISGGWDGRWDGLRGEGRGAGEGGGPRPGRCLGAVTGWLRTNTPSRTVPMCLHTSLPHVNSVAFL